MAKLTLTQQARDIEREKNKQEAIKKKMEIQRNKELYGENWKDVLKQKMEHEIEIEIGSSKTPKIYDSRDLYDFFDPIIIYKTNEGDPIKMDYQHFLDSEVKYKEALDALNLELAESKKDNETENILSEDGVNEEDKLLPVSTSESADKARQQAEGQSVISKRKGIMNKIASTYFSRFVPLYDKHICTCCGRPLTLNNYYVVYNVTCSDRVDDRGNYHMWICKECVQKLFAYCYSILADKNIELAMQYVCTYLNLYWDVDVFYAAKQVFEEKDRKGTLIGSYISMLNRDYPGKVFLDSPFLEDEQLGSANRVVVVGKDEAPYDWSAEDAKNKKTVIHMVGYDPFEYENEEDKRILYRDLLNILDEGMQNDFVKFQAGIQIVQSFYKIRKMNEKQSKMEKEDAPLSDQKAISDLKAKELKSITDFSRDNGFAERYANAKAKGENTLTGIMNKMNEQKYEKAVLNRYDVETSATIQQAADASFKAIFNQLSLGESEIWKITQDQFEELTKLRKELSKTQEELRKTKYELATVNLKEKEKEHNKKLGIEEEENE